MMPDRNFHLMQLDSNSAASTGIIIRPMALDDLAQVVAIDQMSFSLPWPAHSFRYEVLDNEVSRQWVAEMQYAGPDTNLARTQADPDRKTSEVVGMIVVWLILDEAHIATIAVHPQYRRLGIGRKLLLTALHECVAQGASTATLEVRERNLIAIDMYRKFGFEVVGRRKRYYNDTNEDAILMTLDTKGLNSLIARIGG